MITFISSLWLIANLFFFHLFRSSASSFSSQYLLLFLKSSRICLLLLLLPTAFNSVICSSMASWKRQFLLRILPTQLAFLHRTFFRSVIYSYIHWRTGSLFTFSYHFIFSILIHHHISKFSKYFCSNFLRIQVSEPYKTMLQT